MKMITPIPNKKSKIKVLIFIFLFSLNLTHLALALSLQDDIENTPHQKNLTKFFDAVEDIKRNYVKEVSEEKLYENAIRGMLEGLDPHSSYLDKEDLHFLNSTTTGKYSGVGLELIKEDGATKVISALDGSPAKEANIKPGDYLLKINNMPLMNLPLQDVIKKIQGPNNSIITLTFYRKGQTAPFTIRITRKVINLKSVNHELLEPGYAYVRIGYFQEQTPDELSKAIKILEKKSGGKLKGMVLDLRNNPGGLLDSAVEVADKFIDGHKPIVSAKGRTPDSIFAVDSSKEKDLLNKAPLVILINGGSASGSEIVAGALQDYRRAIIMGQTSFGKGSVQTVFALEGGKTAMKLTTSLYYTPSGRSIQAKGIVPDIKLENKTIVSRANQDDGFDIKESELENHLSVDNPPPHPLSNNSIKVTDSDSNQALLQALQKDYQIQEALHLLKGLTVSTSYASNTL